MKEDGRLITIMSEIEFVFYWAAVTERGRKWE